MTDGEPRKDYTMRLIMVGRITFFVNLAGGKEKMNIDLNQPHLPLHPKREIDRTPPWLRLEQKDAQAMVEAERRHLAESRAEFIDMICSQYRDGGAEIKLTRPDSGENRSLHLFVNGKCVGYFDESKGHEGLVFRQV